MVQEQGALSKKLLKSVQDIATRWNSVFYMLSRLLCLKVAIVDLFQGDDNFVEVTSLLCIIQ